MTTSITAFRLRLTSLWPALAALVAALALLWWQIPQLQERTVVRQLYSVLDLLAPQVQPRLGQPLEELQPWVEELAADGPLRITIIHANGTVFADSARTLDETSYMENHGQRPEVLMAWEKGRGVSVRRSTTTGLSYVYTARPVPSSSGERWVLRVAQPLEELAALRQRLLLATLVAAAVGLLAMAIVSWHLDRRYFRPATELIEDAAKLPDIGFSHRVAIPDQPDLGRLARVINTLSTQGQAQLAALESERDQLKAILSSMSEGVLVTDRDGRAVLANPAFRKLFGLRAPVVGMSPLEICRRPQLAKVIEEATGRSGVPPMDRPVQTHDDRTVFLTGAHLRGNGGAVIVARDITEEERLVTMRRDFVANVSHELKTPLAAIRGYAETLRDGALEEPDTARRFVDRVLGQCQRLQALLADLLTLSRLESVSPAPDSEPVNLWQVAEHAFELVRQEAEKKDIRTELDLQEVPRIPGRSGDLERLLVNLLQNAVRYNRPGGRVLLRMHQAGSQIVIEVEDTGLGIPQESLPRLFERFYRVDKGRSRCEGGTGLGLSIVKHVAQAHGGEVEVESSTGEGSTFRVRLPLPRQRQTA
jgi:two-component system phosphate regulon sensor histidine kinase PhoR